MAYSADVVFRCLFLVLWFTRVLGYRRLPGAVLLVSSLDGREG